MKMRPSSPFVMANVPSSRVPIRSSGSVVPDRRAMRSQPDLRGSDWLSSRQHQTSANSSAFGDSQTVTLGPGRESKELGCRSDLLRDRDQLRNRVGAVLLPKAKYSGLISNAHVALPSK